MRLSFECLGGRTRADLRRLVPRILLSRAVCRLRALACLWRGVLWRRQVHAGAAGLRQPNRDCLFRRASAMLALADVFHLLADELAGLRRRSFPLAFIFPRTFECFSVGHVPPSRRIDHARSLPPGALASIGGMLLLQADHEGRPTRYEDRSVPFALLAEPFDTASRQGSGGTASPLRRWPNAAFFSGALP